MDEFKIWVTSNWSKSHREANNSIGKVDCKCLTVSRTSEGDYITGFGKDGMHNTSQLSKESFSLVYQQGNVPKWKTQRMLTNSLNFHSVGRGL